MKKIIKYLLPIAYCLLPIASFSQINLVPNPSFEDKVSCTNVPGQINLAITWISPTLGSPDYFNNCNIQYFGTPVNSFGVENARTGVAYCGIGVFCLCSGFSNLFREYIQTTLTSTLIKNETYCAEFYVSLGDSSSEYAVNNIGVYFSPIVVTSNNYDPLPYVPQIVNSSSNPLTNMNGWTKVSGQFIALGGEKYITIGNFNYNTTSDTVLVRKFPISSPISSYKQSYYYIDDVSVIHIDADAGQDTAVCKGSSLQLGKVASPGLTYSWQPAIGLNNTTIAQPIATPTVTTTYYLTAALAGGCAKQDTVTVTVVNANAGNDTTLCKGNRAMLGTIGLTNVTYNWQPTIGLNNAAIAQPQATLNNTTTYKVTATANGCTQQDEVNITVLPYQTPTTNISTAPTICIGDTISIGTTAIAGYKYVWSPINNLSDATSAMPFAFPTQTTQYHLIVMDTASTYLCKTNGMDSVLITVNECPPIIPNIFTPNGDWINDEFVINNLPERSSLTIYNRWGTLVWSTLVSSPSPSGRLGGVSWDGRTTSGVACVNGVYYYVLTLKAGKVYNGFVELVR